MQSEHPTASFWETKQSRTQFRSLDRIFRAEPHNTPPPPPMRTGVESEKNPQHALGRAAHLLEHHYCVWHFCRILQKLHTALLRPILFSFWLRVTSPSQLLRRRWGLLPPWASQNSSAAPGSDAAPGVPGPWLACVGVITGLSTGVALAMYRLCRSIDGRRRAAKLWTAPR